MAAEEEQNIETVKAFEEELKALTRKYNMTINATINFPIYKELPVEVQLAMRIIQKHGGVYQILYQLK